MSLGVSDLRPFAEYQLTACPPDVQVTSPDGGTITVLGPEVVVARAPGQGIYVQFTTASTRGWGGVQNHKLRWLDGAWVIAHLGHPGTIMVRGKILRGRSSLADGDTVEPSRGLVFTFRTRADLEEHWSALEREGALGSADEQRAALTTRGVSAEALPIALRHFALRMS